MWSEIHSRNGFSSLFSKITLLGFFLIGVATFWGRVPFILHLELMNVGSGVLIVAYLCDFVSLFICM